MPPSRKTETSTVLRAGRRRCGDSRLERARQRARRRRRRRARARRRAPGRSGGRGPCPRAAASRARPPAGRAPPRRRRGGGARSGRSRCSSGPCVLAGLQVGGDGDQLRSAFWRQEAVARLLPLRVGVAHRAVGEASMSAARVAGVSAGVPQNSIALRPAAAGSAERRQPACRSARTAASRCWRPSGRGTWPCRASATRPSPRRSAGGTAAGPSPSRARSRRRVDAAAVARSRPAM